MKINTIEIRAKEWFDKTYGNSYFSARVYVNDELVEILPFQYGYGDHYIDMAGQALDEAGVIHNPKRSNGTRAALHTYCQENNISLFTEKQERCLKRELDK